MTLLVSMWLAIAVLDDRGATIAGAVAVTVALTAALGIAALALRRPAAATERGARTFRAFAIASPSAQAILTVDHRILQWNPAASRIFGASEREAIGQTVENTLATPFGPAAGLAIDRVLETREPYPVETSFEVAGKQVSIQGSLFPIEIDEVTTGVGAVLWDVTEFNARQRASESLRSLLDAIINSAYEGIVSTDADGVIVTYNWGAERLFGVAPPAAVGRPIGAFVDVFDGESLPAMIGREPRLDVDGTGTRADGTTFVVRGSVAALAFDGNPMFVMVLRDASEARARQEAVEQARIAAEEANAAKTEFLSRISHELRIPLNVILGFGQVVQLDREISAPHQESLSHIIGAGRHLVNLRRCPRHRRYRSREALAVDGAGIAVRGCRERCGAHAACRG